jgi:hypothetical protein
MWSHLSILLLILTLLNLSESSIPLSICFDTCAVTNTSKTCFLVCGFCATPQLSIGLSQSDRSKYCGNFSPEKIYSKNQIVDLITSAVMNVSSTFHGYYFNDVGPELNATLCLKHLIAHAPRRDLVLLFTETHSFVSFMMDHIRWALKTRNVWGFIPWDIFLDYVLPYSIIDEPRDISYRWRARYNQLFMDLIEKKNEWKLFFNCCCAVFGDIDS